MAAKFLDLLLCLKNSTSAWYNNMMKFVTWIITHAFKDGLKDDNIGGPVTAQLFD